MNPSGATIHASAVLAGAHAVLIRGPSGSGKSRLAFALIESQKAGLLPFARLVGDDRVFAQAVNGRLLVRPPAELQGLLEIRGLGLRRLPFEPLAAAGLAVDLDAEDADRMPPEQAAIAVIEGVRLARLAVARRMDPLPSVLGFLHSGHA